MENTKNNLWILLMMSIETLYTFTAAPKKVIWLFINSKVNSSVPNLKVIIADDHPAFRKGMEAMLKTIPSISKIFLATDGTDVINALNEEHFDIILMDISMKPMGGVEATAIVRDKFPQTKVIAVSMHEEENIIADMLACGATGYLLKNADKEEIQKAIEEVSSGKTFYSHEASRVIIEILRSSEEPNNYQKQILQKDRFREILFLLCHDLSNKEMAEILCLSERTIEYYKNQIRVLTGKKKAFGIVQYAIKRGILNDPLLQKRFAKHLQKNEN